MVFNIGFEFQALTFEEMKSNSISRLDFGVQLSDTKRKSISSLGFSFMYWLSSPVEAERFDSVHPSCHLGVYAETPAAPACSALITLTAFVAPRHGAARRPAPCVDLHLDCHDLALLHWRTS